MKKFHEAIEKIVEDNLKLYYGADGEVENIGFNNYMLAQEICDNMKLDEEYLSDIIYCATAYLPLPDKDVARLNDRLLKDITKANLIKMKEIK